jgi:hypothetical protein
MIRDYIMRGSADDLRKRGLTVAVHNDYRRDGVRHTFWLVTWELTPDGVIRAFKGEGETDAIALDLIRAQFVAAGGTL